MRVGDLVRSKMSGSLVIVLEVADSHIGFVHASGPWLGKYDTCSRYRLEVLNESR
jgi:hypothetical protein